MGQSHIAVGITQKKTSTISEKPNALYPPPPRISRSHPKRHCPGFSLFPVVPAGFFLSFSVFRRYAIGLPRRQAPTSTPEKPPCNRKPSIGLGKDLLDVDPVDDLETFPTCLILPQTCTKSTPGQSRKSRSILKGKSVVLFFAEPSARTKTSFDMAGKRLSADTFGLAKSGSSLQKGESMKDTALTLQAMNPDVIVIRHSSSGAAQFLAERLHCGVVNAGDGWHAHPTQALLDAFSLRQVWGHDRNAFKGKNLLILGDCAHSRVCRSNVLLLTKLGVNVSLCAPRTLLPAGVDNWPVTVYTDSKKAVRDMDAVMCLRLQLERQQAGLLPDLREYSKRFCLTTAHMELARPGAHIMHPGPILRGLDVSDALADSSQSLILDQVSAGVSVRMAVLYLLATRPDIKDNL